MATVGIRLTRVALLLAVATSLLWAAGCGGGNGGDGGATAATTAQPSALEGLSAEQVLEKARAAAKAAKSVHVTGEVKGTPSLTLDLTLAGATGGRGAIEINGGHVDVVLIGEDVYFKADRQILTQAIGAGGEEAVKLIGDRYIKAKATDERFKEIANFVNLEGFVEQLLTPEGTIKRVDGKPVDGVRTVGLLDQDKQNGGTMYVADEGTPYPLLLESPSAGQQGNVRLSDWDADVTVAAPPDDQVVDLGKLQR